MILAVQTSISVKVFCQTAGPMDVGCGSIMLSIQGLGYRP